MAGPTFVYWLPMVFLLTGLQSSGYQLVLSQPLLLYLVSENVGQTGGSVLFSISGRIGATFPNESN